MPNCAIEKVICLVTSVLIILDSMYFFDSAVNYDRVRLSADMRFWSQNINRFYTIVPNKKIRILNKWQS